MKGKILLMWKRGVWKAIVGMILIVALNELVIIPLFMGYMPVTLGCANWIAGMSLPILLLVVLFPFYVVYWWKRREQAKKAELVEQVNHAG